MGCVIYTLWRILSGSRICHVRHSCELSPTIIILQVVDVVYRAIKAPLSHRINALNTANNHSIFSTLGPYCPIYWCAHTLPYFSVFKVAHILPRFYYSRWIAFNVYPLIFWPLRIPILHWKRWSAEFFSLMRIMGLPQKGSVLWIFQFHH